MDIKLISIAIRNFMSIQKADVKFPKKGVIVVTGVNSDDPNNTSNGAGKSTLMDAISFAIYGRTIRPIKKDGMLPKGRKVKGVVKVALSVGDNVITIMRYLDKPTAIITSNGLRLKLDSDAIGDYINLDHKTFTNINVLTRQESFIFESKAQRLKMFERFTGLDDVMQKLEKAASTVYKGAIKKTGELTGEKQSLEHSKLRLASELQNFSGHIHPAEEQTYIRTEDSLRSVTHLITTPLADMVRKLQDKMQQTALDFSHACAEIGTKISNTQLGLVNIKSSIKDARRGRCQSCGATLDQKKVQSELKRLLDSLAEYRARMGELNQNQLTLADQRAVAEAFAKQINGYIDAMRDCCTTILVLLKQASVINNGLLVDTKSDSSKRAYIEQQLADVTTQLVTIEKSLKQAAQFETASDVGVTFVRKHLRKHMLKSYVASFNADLEPTMLAVAGFSGKFTEDFNIVLRDMPFENASTGEQMRFMVATYVNLYRYAALNKNRMNLMIFDDFDLGIDDAGKQALINVIDALGQSMLVFVLSQSELFSDYFPQSIVAVKENGITKYNLQFE